jgi:hypothetical protein
LPICKKFADLFFTFKAAASQNKTTILLADFFTFKPGIHGNTSGVTAFKTAVSKNKTILLLAGFFTIKT